MTKFIWQYQEQHVCTSTVQDFGGQQRIGAMCRRTFSRKDALVRHLKNPKCKCVCDVLPAEEYIGIDLL